MAILRIQRGNYTELQSYDFCSSELFFDTGSCDLYIGVDPGGVGNYKLISSASANWYVTSSVFNTATGIISFTGFGGINFSESIDGRYVLTSSFEEFTESYYEDSTSFDYRTLQLETTFSISVDARLDALENATSSVSGNYVDFPTFETASASLLNQIGEKLDTSSFDIFSQSFVTASASFDYRLDSLESGSGSYLKNYQTGAVLTGSFTGSFVGDGSGLINVPFENWYPQSITFVSSSGHIQISGSGMGQLSTAISLDTRYVTNTKYEADSASFNNKLAISQSGNPYPYNMGFQDADIGGQGGELTLFMSGAADIVVDLDGRYLRFAPYYIDSASFDERINNLDYISQSGVPLGTISSSQQITDLGFISSSASIYPYDMGFEDSDFMGNGGELTLYMSGAADIVVDLDGRYLRELYFVLASQSFDERINAITVGSASIPPGTVSSSQQIIDYGIFLTASSDIGALNQFTQSYYIDSASFDSRLDLLEAGTGSVGATGPQGFQGNQGFQGFQGNEGLVGATGITGPQGNQGNQGFSGDVGATGITGPQGFQGNQGFIGSTGPQGNQGNQGFQGNDGLVGATGNIGPQGNQGLSGDVGSTGPQGNQGFQGNQGLSGDVGSTGLTGPQGNQGLIGATGELGPQGNQGFQGNVGLDGATGLTGPQGNQGFQGNQGLIGATGIGEVGATGVQGFQGPAGSGEGSVGATGPQGNQGFQGNIGETGATGLSGLQGNQGFQGFIGLQGFQGNDGSIGATGLTGPQGNQGFQGNDGLIGATGDLGPQGNQGFQGNDGSTGLTGPQGNQGFQGNDGSIGATGITGPQGNQGFQGNDGSIGATGITGPQGNQGFQGNDGSIGATGITGPQGNQGNQGFQGNDGLVGATGLTGPQGNQGFQGFNGTQGNQGYQGFQGNEGLIGATGVQGFQGLQGDPASDNYVDSITIQNHSVILGRTGVLTDISASLPIGLVSSSVQVSDITGSSVVTASFLLNDITFTKGNGTQFVINLSNLDVATAANTHIIVKNVSGITIPKGTPLYITGSGTSGNIAGVVPADAGNPNLMPAGAVAAEELIDEAEGFGWINGYISGVDTSVFQSGNAVYVAVGGGYTAIKPTGSALIQKLGNVEKSSLNGSGVINGPGYYNDVPNIQQGYVWVGNVDSVAIPTSTASFVENFYPTSMSFDSASGYLYVSGVGVNLSTSLDDRYLEVDTYLIDSASFNERIISGSLLQVLSTCSGGALPTSTDVFGIFDGTSMALSDVETASLALRNWFAEYTASHPEHSGGLYIITTADEDYLSHPVNLLNNTFTNLAGGGYELLNIFPPDWGVGYTYPSSSVVLSFIDEVDNEYHGGSVVLTGQPTANYIQDYNNYIDFYGRVDFFRGVLYPIHRATAEQTKALYLQGLAAMKGRTLTIAEISASLGSNVTEIDVTVLTGSNPYTTSLEDVGWVGVFTKKSPAVDVFTSQTFASELNDILGIALNIESRVSLVQSYESNTLTIRGLKSTTLDFNVDASGCIGVEVDETNFNSFTASYLSFSQSVDSRLDNLEAFSSSLDTTFATEAEVSGYVEGISSSFDIRIFNLENGTGSVGATGPQGPQGPQGFVGETGATGLTGPQGFQGPQGFIGATGPQGPSGSIGATGPGFVDESGNPIWTSSYECMFYPVYSELNPVPEIPTFEQICKDITRINVDEVGGTAGYPNIRFVTGSEIDSILFEFNEFGGTQNSESIFSVNSSGSVLAAAYYGDGGNLTNVVTTYQLNVSELNAWTSSISSSVHNIEEWTASIGQEILTSVVTASFINTASVEVSHSFGTRNVIVSVYDDLGYYVLPDEILVSDENNVTVSFTDNKSGYVVVAKAGHIITNTTSQMYDAVVTASFTSVTSSLVTHNFGTKNVIVSVYDNTDYQIQPDYVYLVNDNSVEIGFTTPTSGYTVVAKAGHLVSGTLDIVPTLNSLGVLSGSELVYNLANSTLTIDGFKVGRGSYDTATNTAVGVDTIGNNLTATHTTAVGYKSQQNNGDADFNTSLGACSLGWISGSEAGHNTAIGYKSMSGSAEIVGGCNTAVGSLSLIDTSGSVCWNVAVGYNSGPAISPISGTISVGYEARARGNDSIAIGRNAVVDAGATNSILIGVNTTITGSNTVKIGNANNDTYQIYGASWNNISDARDKECVTPISNGLGLPFVLKLNPVEYRYDYRENYELACNFYYGTKDGSLISDKKGYGLIAQEVETVLNELGEKFEALNYDTMSDQYSIGYTQFIPVLIKAIQDQQTQIEELKARLRDLENR